MEAVEKYLKGIKNVSDLLPDNSTAKYLPKEYKGEETCTSMFIALLFKIANMETT